MSDIKLTYFSVRARGETIRLVLHAAKKKFEDKRIEFSEWPPMKANTPYGGLPIIEIGGQVFGQGMAIATYLANENGLNGANSKEALMIDTLQQLREDLLVAEAKFMFEPDEAKKEEIIKNLNEETRPKFFGYMNDIIAKNPAKSGFAVGKKLSLGDIAVHVATDTAFNSDPKCLDKFPEIKAVRAKVEGADGIKQYLASRPETPI